MTPPTILTSSNDHPTEASEPQTIAGFAASTVVLFVAAACLLGLVWGAVDGDWVLVAVEGPAVLALVGVWLFTRANRAGHRVATIAAAIGALCAVELWIATAVFDARGTTLAVIAAASTGATVAIAGLWAALVNQRA
ncbi:MAG: hypothetical protein ACRBK7_11420 [Acidimicrobiales bacterium]